MSEEEINKITEITTWFLSCDNCNSQEEGKHYCLLHGIPIKNMDIKTCIKWEEKGEMNE